MVVLNNKMFLLLRAVDWEHRDLQYDLLGIVSGGFVLHEECFFLKRLIQSQMHVRKSDFFDDVACECFVNSIHVDDYVEGDYLVQAVLFMDEVFERWIKYNSEKTLVCIISQTEFGASIKFHVKRKGQKWIEENDVEKFEEAIVICES